jgi:hypothetical protein
VRQPRSSPTPGSSPNGRFVMKHGTDLAVSRVGESGRCCHLVQPWSQATCEISPLDRSLDQRRLSRARRLRFPSRRSRPGLVGSHGTGGRPKPPVNPGRFRQRHGGHRGAGLTPHTGVSQSSQDSVRLGHAPGDNNGQSRSPTVHSARRLTLANATRLTRPGWHAVYGIQALTESWSST